jgi:hypothetical protein
MTAAKYCRPGGATSDNKGYALHSLAVVRAAPHRAKSRATSHNQSVLGNMKNKIGK